MKKLGKFGIGVIISAVVFSGGTVLALQSSVDWNSIISKTESIVNDLASRLKRSKTENEILEKKAGQLQKDKDELLLDKSTLETKKQQLENELNSLRQGSQSSVEEIKNLKQQLLDKQNEIQQKRVAYFATPLQYSCINSL